MNPPTDPLSPTPLSEAVETLRPWGLRHHENCPVWWRTGQPKSCSCGLDAALGEAPKPTVEDLEAYIDLALIRWVPGDDAGLARHIAESIHPRLVPVSPSVDPEDPGHCAGPSWAAHEVTEVYEGDTCPSCGTVML